MTLLATVVVLVSVAGATQCTFVSTSPQVSPGDLTPGGGSGKADRSQGTAGGPGIEAYRGAGWVARENAKPGTTDWQVSADPKTWDRIRGYADHVSVNWGEPFGLYVSTSDPTWHAEVYRVGWYGGNGARLVWTSPDQQGVSQAPSVMARKTSMVTAPWAESLAVSPDGSWPPGQYLIKLVSSAGGASFVPIVLRDDASTAALLVQSSVTTWQAYNNWGGRSLYSGTGRVKARAQVVSFDRPYGGNGSGEFFGREFELINFLERSGYDVTYWTDVDLDEQPALALQHKAVLSGAHDEYYSPAMRTGLETARDHGVNLAFFGANASFRKIRLDASALGQDRQEVNYRVASDDPMNATHPDQVTVSWRQAPSNKPESSLVGDYYECNPVQADMIVADPTAWMFAGSGFKKGDRIPKAVGNEYDRVTPEAPTPPGIEVLMHSPVTCRSRRSFSDSTWYTTASGAGVWASGTFRWVTLLQFPCQPGTGAGYLAAKVLSATDPSCKLQKVTANLLDAFSRGPAGAAHPAHSNLAALGIHRGYVNVLNGVD